MHNWIPTPAIPCLEKAKPSSFIFIKFAKQAVLWPSSLDGDCWGNRSWHCDVPLFFPLFSSHDSEHPRLLILAKLRNVCVSLTGPGIAETQFSWDCCDMDNTEPLSSSLKQGNYAGISPHRAISPHSGSILLFSIIFISCPLSRRSPGWQTISDKTRKMSLKAS